MSETPASRDPGPDGNPPSTPAEPGDRPSLGSVEGRAAAQRSGPVDPALRTAAHHRTHPPPDL